MLRVPGGGRELGAPGGSRVPVLILPLAGLGLLGPRPRAAGPLEAAGLPCAVHPHQLLTKHSVPRRSWAGVRRRPAPTGKGAFRAASSRRVDLDAPTSGLSILHLGHQGRRSHIVSLVPAGKGLLADAGGSARDAHSSPQLAPGSGQAGGQRGREAPCPHGEAGTLQGIYGCVATDVGPALSLGPLTSSSRCLSPDLGVIHQDLGASSLCS